MTSRSLHVAEPPPLSIRRAPLVVDSSVIAGAVFQEHWREAAEAQIADRDLHAPFLLQVEFASVVVKKSRRSEPQLAAAALRAFQRMSVELHRVDEQGVVELAMKYQLSAYDAAYLWLAADLRLPLATFDERLGAAASIHLSSLS